MTQHGKILFLLGVSGSGKTTMINLLQERLSSHFTYVLSYTTRDLRPGETSGIRYNFISVDEFKNDIENNKFLEYAVVHQKDYYGTRLDSVENVLNTGKNAIKEVDALGLKKIVESGYSQDNFYSLFLDVDESVMKERITSRAPISNEELERRLESSRIERELAQKYCNVIIKANPGIEEVYNLVISEIQKLGLL